MLARICFLCCCFMILSGCATVPENLWQLNRATSDRFTYVSDQAKWGVESFVEVGVTGEKQFSGDCEEYAFAMVFQLNKRGIAAQVWVVSTKSGLHAITCTLDGWCLDYDNVPVRKERASYYDFMTIMPVSVSLGY